MIKSVLPLFVPVCFASGQHEFVLANNLGDSLKILSRDADGQERLLRILFSSDGIQVPRSTDLGLVDTNNNVLPISRFPSIRYTDLDWYNREYEGIFPIGFGSDIPSQFESVILIPQNNRHVLITNPVDLEAYCFDNTAQFVPTINGGNAFSVSMSLDTRSVGISVMFSFALSGEKLSSVPAEIYDPISDEVERIGCSPEALVQLPPIRFRIANTAVIEILPEDYVEEIHPGTCQLKIESSDWPTMGTNILKNIGVMIDYRNHRVGICDPI